MTATEQNDIALHFVKQAGPYQQAAMQTAQTAGQLAWDGAKMVPGVVGMAANGASALNNFRQGNWGQGLADVGWGALSAVGGNTVGLGAKALLAGSGMLGGSMERNAQAESQKQTMNQAKNYVDALRGSAGNHINPQLT